MKAKLYFIILLLLVITSCRKDDPGDNNHNNNNNNSTTFSGLWYELDGVESPDYVTSAGPSVWQNNAIHTLVFNKFFRMKYLEIAQDTVVTMISTPFENEQNINFPCMAADNDNVFVAYALFLGNTRAYAYLRTGSTWQTLPELMAPGYSFNNKIMAAAMLNGQPYLLAQGMDSTYIFTWHNGAWEVAGGKAIGPTFYYVDLKAGGGRLLALGYNPPSGNNAGLILKEWKNQQWADAGFTLNNPGDEIIIPNIDINPSGAALLNYMSYSGSVIYKQQGSSAAWEKVFERDASADFAFRARFDKVDPSVFYAARVTHPAQPERVIWGAIKFDASGKKEYLIDSEHDIPGTYVIFNPVLYQTFEMIPHNKKIHFTYTEDRAPIIGHRVLLVED